MTGARGGILHLKWKGYMDVYTYYVEFEHLAFSFAHSFSFLLINVSTFIKQTVHLDWFERGFKHQSPEFNPSSLLWSRKRHGQKLHQKNKYEALNFDMFKFQSPLHIRHALRKTAKAEMRQEAIARLLSASDVWMFLGWCGQWLSEGMKEISHRCTCKHTSMKTSLGGSDAQTKLQVWTLTLDD